MKSIAQSPLALAALYQSGLGKTWENQKQAAEALARLKVTRTHINRAMRLSALPEAVLSLFSSVQILDRTARELLRVQRKLGAEQLEQRAAVINPEGRSWSEIVAMLEGKEPVSPAYRLHYSGTGPGTGGSSGMSLNIRGTPSTLTFEMTFQVEDAEQLIVSAVDVESMIMAVLQKTPRKKG